MNFHTLRTTAKELTNFSPVKITTAIECCTCVKVEGGGFLYIWGRGEKARGGGRGRSEGGGTNPDLEGLQAGCSDSVLRKGISASNGPAAEGEFPVVGPGLRLGLGRCCSAGDWSFCVELSDSFTLHVLVEILVVILIVFE